MRLMCGHCGHTNPDTATFCERCDEYLDWSAKRVADPAPASPAPTAPVQPVRPTATQPPVGSAAPAAASTPAAGRPAAAPAPAGRPAAAAPAAVAPTPPAGTTCPACVVANPPERRFCRHCGAWLVEPVAVPAAPYVPWHRSWWQRLIGPRGRAERAAYRRSLSPVTRAFRIGLAVLAVVLLAVLVSPLVNPVRWVRDTVESALGSGRVDHAKVLSTPLTTPAEGTAPQAAALAAEEALRATDGIRGWMWIAPWPAGAQAAGAEQLPECGATPAGRAPTGLTIALAGAPDVREIGIEAGAPESFGLSGAAPETVDLVWTRDDAGENNGEATRVCQRVTLAATPDLQRFRVTQGRVAGVRLLVVTARPPTEQRPGPLRIGEITFWER